MSDCLLLQGAIYVTDNAAYSWKAAVQETVDATLNRTVSSGRFPLLKPGSPAEEHTVTSHRRCARTLLGSTISGASYYKGSFSQIGGSVRST